MDASSLCYFPVGGEAMIHYNLTDAQAKYLLTAKSLTMIEPLREPPARGYVYMGDDDIPVAFTSNTPGTMDIASHAKRFPFGAKVGLRETWWTRREYLEDVPDPEYKYCGAFWYKIDGDENNPLNEYHWKPPATMPDAAIRHWGTVVSNRVCRAVNVTDDEWFSWSCAERTPSFRRGRIDMSIYPDWEVRYTRRFSRRKQKPDFEKDWVEVAMVKVARMEVER